MDVSHLYVCMHLKLCLVICLLLFTASQPWKTPLPSSAPKYKTSNEFGTCHRNDQYGQKGQQLSKCLECVAINATSCKQKCSESDFDTPMESTMPLALSAPQFVEELAGIASAPDIDANLCVSLQGLPITGKDIANYLASLAWKATEYHFT